MKPVCLITGAAGFIGNAACQWYRDRYHVIGVDDFSRPTAVEPEGVDFYRADATDIPGSYEIGGANPDIVIHLAAQVSVMDSYAHPYQDFLRNAEMTFKLSQWAAMAGVKTFIYSSTNKVYGDLEGRGPVSDLDPINPSTPYGISKATGGLYVREFLPQSGFDFRQSCIYGKDQQGTEDQGWVGYISRRIRNGEPVTCFGDGKQVRDLLHVSDLLRAYDMAIEGKIPAGSYVVGGGWENSVTFSEVVDLLGGSVSTFADWRPHDQRYFVASPGLLLGAGWKPQVSAREWLCSQRVAA